MLEACHWQGMLPTTSSTPTPWVNTLPMLLNPPLWRHLPGLLHSTPPLASLPLPLPPALVVSTVHWSRPTRSLLQTRPPQPLPLRHSTCETPALRSRRPRASLRRRHRHQRMHLLRRRSPPTARETSRRRGRSRGNGFSSPQTSR
jgi:hypothetical protein